MASKSSLAAICLLILLLGFFGPAIPFFWDTIHFSEIANHFYSHGFGDFVVPLPLDEGPFPFWGVYFATGWKLFGRNLFVSHLLMMPFILGTFIGFYKLCKYFLNDRSVSLALVLLLADPVMDTQSLIMSYDVALLCFFLFAVNTLLKNNLRLYAVILILISMCNIRGPVVVAALALIHGLLPGKQTGSRDIRRMSVPYLPCIFLLFGWYIYHHLHAGWYLFSPFKEKTDEQLVSGTMILRQFAYIIWKVCDFGRILLWLFLLIAYFLPYKKKDSTGELSSLNTLFFIPLLVLSFSMIFFSNPPGHKYFLIPFAMLDLTCVYMLQQIKNRKTSLVIASVLLLSLLSGNFWLYPQKFGNGWDSSLKVLPYFQLRNEMEKFIQLQHISPENIGALFPLYKDSQYTDLSIESSSFSDLDKTPLSQCGYAIVSNLYNTRKTDELEKIGKQWKLIKQFRKGQVELLLYKNPN